MQKQPIPNVSEDLNAQQTYQSRADTNQEMDGKMRKRKMDSSMDQNKAPSMKGKNRKIQDDAEGSEAKSSVSKPSRKKRKQLGDFRLPMIQSA